ncbi:MAG: Hsp20/alpha crystallin family protein [Vicingaceae bacterium]
MTLVKFKDSFPSFLDEFFGGDIFDTNKNSSWIGNSLPAVNVKENENNFEVEVAAPGMQKDDFKIELDNKVLGISSELKEEHVDEQKKYTRREFSYRSFKRTFSLPENVDQDGIQASYKDGVLKIEIPKEAEKEKVNSRRIDIS